MSFKNFMLAFLTQLALGGLLTPGGDVSCIHSWGLLMSLRIQGCAFNEYHETLIE